MNTSKIYYLIDTFKLVCAILILFMHTYNRDGGEIGAWFLNVLSSIGVPFFFIASGFFYTKGLIRHNKTNTTKEYFTKYFKRVSLMYIAWTILTLPIAYLIIERAHGDYSTFLKFIYLIRLILFTGSIGIYWYVLALVYNSIILYFAFKKKLKYSLFIGSFILWIIGCVYNSPFNNGNMFFESIHIVFGSERNFLNVGLFYMAIGYLFAQHEEKIHFKLRWIIVAFLVSILLRTLEVEYYHTHTLQALQATLLFLIGINISFKPKYYSTSIRELSTAIYLQHFPFILLFDFYLQKGTRLDFTITLLFCIIMFFVIKRILPHKFYKTLYGG